MNPDFKASRISIFGKKEKATVSKELWPKFHNEDV